jgi:hypothetical protein
MEKIAITFVGTKLLIFSQKLVLYDCFFFRLMCVLVKHDWENWQRPGGVRTRCEQTRPKEAANGRLLFLSSASKGKKFAGGIIN